MKTIISSEDITLINLKEIALAKDPDENLFTKAITILKYFYDLLIPGGIIMFSGYTSPPHEGEAVAIENFLKKNKKIKLKKLAFSNYPVAYFIK